VPSGTPLPSDPDAFWNGTPDEEEAAPVGEDGAAEGGDAALLSGRAPGGPAAHHPPALLTSLGRPPFWKGHGSPEETLDEMTARAADLAAALLAGEE
jgi:hypothetical protein